MDLGKRKIATVVLREGRRGGAGKGRRGRLPSVSPTHDVSRVFFPPAKHSTFNTRIADREFLMATLMIYY